MCGLNDLSRAYEIFVEKFTLIYDKCFLLRTMKARRFSLREPWFTKGLAKCKGRNISYTSHSLILIPLTLPLKMLITRTTALSFRSSCKEAFILWKKNLKNLNQMLRPRGEFWMKSLKEVKESVVYPLYVGYWDSREISNPREIAHLFCKYFNWSQFSWLNLCIRKIKRILPFYLLRYNHGKTC